MQAIVPYVVIAVLLIVLLAVMAKGNWGRDADRYMRERQARLKQQAAAGATGAGTGRETANPVPSWPVPDSGNEEDYVRACSEAAFPERKEDRTFRSDPAFGRVLDPLNSRQYPAAITAAQSLIPLFPDFDLPYKWLGSAYRATNQLQLSRDALARGLAEANRKSVLLTDMGDTQWQMGNIHDAVYFWCQALHCLSANPVAGVYEPYLFLSYVAKGCGLGDVEQRLLARVDAMRPGTIRLEPTTANRLTELVRSKNGSAMSRVIRDIAA